MHLVAPPLTGESVSGLSPGLAFDPTPFQTRLVFDRRRLPRKAFEERAMAVFSTNSADSVLTSVTIVDASHVGLGLRSPIAVEPGDSVSLLPDSPMWPRQIGIVVRCEPCEDGGFHVGLLSKRRTLAA